MKVFSLIFSLLLLLNSSTYAQDYLGKRHQLMVGGSFDYYLNHFNTKSTGIATVNVYNMPGFKGELSYNLRLFKQKEGYLTLDAGYGRQYYKSGIYYDFGEHYGTDQSVSKLIPYKYGFSKDYFNLFLGYEHRFSLKQSKMQLLLGAKVGIFYSLKEHNLVVLSSVQPLDSSSVSSWSTYAKTLSYFSSGLNAISGQVTVGVLFPVLKTFNCKLFLAYTDSQLTDGSGELFFFYRSNGELMGEAGNLNRMNHLSLGVAIGLRGQETIKKAKPIKAIPGT